MMKDAQQAGGIERRVRPRIPLPCAIIFGGGDFVAEGATVDLGTPGCAVQASDLPRLGDYLQLAILVPAYECPFSVGVARVRWVRSGCFGVEFLKMPGENQTRIAVLVQDHLSGTPSSLKPWYKSG